MKTPSTPKPASQKAHADAGFIKLTEQLDRAVDELDLSTQLALQRARQHALRSAGQSRSQTQSRAWWAGGGLATAAAALLLAIVLIPGSQNGLPTNISAMGTPTSGIPAMGMVADADNGASISDLALLAEDEFLLLDEELEFYAWLEEELDSTI
ncbi:MAG: hypothetical protein MI750_00255 [Xanthomonadales bacterium]|nr:hypothetical protein [Xanthomonadales bacterium]